MNYTDHDTLIISDVQILNLLPDIGIEKAREEIIAGLVARPKYVSPKFFYDKKGSELFEEITRLEEYYPTRTEKHILGSLFEHISMDFENLDIVELGSGDASKIKLLLKQIPEEHHDCITYYPLDISHSAIEKSTRELSLQFPSIKLKGIVADFFHQLNVLPSNRRKLVCFLGSTLGNLSAEEAEEFMKLLGSEMRTGDAFILGVDMVKDKDVLERAYNDSQGITEAFNLNILHVINRLTGSQFNPSDFEHVSFFNVHQNRVEMHLRAVKEIDLAIQDNGRSGKPVKVHFDKGEGIHTENSYKFTEKRIRQLGQWADLKMESVISDPKQWFSIVHFQKV
jgi:L-histidine N-alpha-methyltransferase